MCYMTLSYDLLCYISSRRRVRRSDGQRLLGAKVAPTRLRWPLAISAAGRRRTHVYVCLHILYVVLYTHMYI